MKRHHCSPPRGSQADNPIPFCGPGKMLPSALPARGKQARDVTGERVKSGKAIAFVLIA